MQSVPFFGSRKVDSSYSFLLLASYGETCDGSQHMVWESAQEVIRLIFKRQSV